MSETETETVVAVEAPSNGRRKRVERTQGQETRTLAERMSAVMGRLQPPPKNGSMQMQGKRIPYVQNDDLMDSLRPALAAEGVAYSISVEDVRKGLVDPVAVMLNVRLASGEESLEAHAYGEGRTFPIAQTYAVKYWLLRTFLVGSGGEDDEIANVASEPARNGGFRPTQPAPQAERRVAQNGTTREAPPTAYREDDGRKSMRRRAWDALVRYYAEGAPAEQAQALVRTGLLGIAEDHPDMVPVVGGEPSLQTASNDQLQRLVAMVEGLGKPGEDVPF
jgi:hypothetical protein